MQNSNEHNISDEVKSSLGFETLKKIGSQKIYEKTHISKAIIEALLTKSFDSLERIQAIGFVSILERDYDIDLSSLKDELENFFISRDGTKDAGTLVIVKEKKRSKFLFFIILFALVGIFSFYVYTENVSNEVTQETITFDEKKIEEVQKDIEYYEAKQIVDENESSEIIEQNKTISTLLDPIILPTLKIMPQKKVWAGVISLEDHSKSERTTKELFELDPEKNWLLVFGHGLVTVSQGDEVFEFSSRKQLRLAYEEGILREVSLQEFKALNKGRSW